MKVFRALAVGLAALLLLLVVAILALVALTGSVRRAAPRAVTMAERTEHRTAPGGRRGLEDKQILFGDLHTHTTFSSDAFLINLPLLGGEGAHPPADACDYARFCSALDFWSINDHAEGLSPLDWRETKASIRACNAVASDPEDPDLVAFLGWEWSQVGTTPDTHFGHKNVVLRETAEERVPARPIAAPREDFKGVSLPSPARYLLPLAEKRHRSFYETAFSRIDELADLPVCAAGGDPRELPERCREVAHDPAELFTKLAHWDSDVLVIPHGTTWGLMTPPGSSWRRQISSSQQSPAQNLLEIYSGHGSAEEYRTHRPYSVAPDGRLVCEAPTPEYLPCCWRAGEIIRERCEAEGAGDCEARAALAREHYLNAGVGAHNTIPGVEVADWLDCGQCRDCALAAMDHRPEMSAQASLAMTDFASEVSARLRFGFIGSSDTHRARPGNGFKERDAMAVTDRLLTSIAAGPFREEPRAESRPIDVDELWIARRRYTERQASFYTSGGLVAVHASGRSRDAIFDALARREAYGTSGERMLLWFDLLNAEDGPAPMGSEQRLAGPPRFRVAAVGAAVQRPGCPESVRAVLSPERIEHVCAGECYHPGDERRPIAAIEIVRVLAQRDPSEPLEALIADPWRRFECDPSPEGCEAEVEDPEFPALGREVAYYARALQAPTPAINGDPLRCERDAEGRCLRAHPCDTAEDDCLSPVSERAWSSPIWIRPHGAARSPGEPHEG